MAGGHLVLSFVAFSGNTFWEIFNSHLFWLNSHPAAGVCEFNQKRCELKIFLLFFELMWHILPEFENKIRAHVRKKVKLNIFNIAINK